MKLSFRWYGNDDKVTLENIKQIPNMQGIVTAIYDVPVGEVWLESKIIELKNTVEEKGMYISAIESVPVHEDIKMGKDSRDVYIDNYIETLKNLAKHDIKLVCYNFMPVFDWTRSELNFVNPDNSTSLIFNEDVVRMMDPKELNLPGWDTSYTKEQMVDLIDFYSGLTHEQLWDNLSYFLNRVIPVAETLELKMAIHPDDPPFDIFGIPRIITKFEDLDKFINLYDSHYNGITLCTGSLGCVNTNDVVKMINYFGKEKNRIHFAHIRNVKNYGKTSFNEVAHPSNYGDIDMFEVMSAYLSYNFDGPYRPDHGRMIWGETGRPGYGLYDRALGCTYLEGLKEAITKEKK